MKELSELLHDSIFISGKLNWSEGTVQLVFELSDGSESCLTLNIRGLSLFECSRNFPWGQSNYVNTITRNVEDGKECFEIEMQSGDNIKVVGKFYDIIIEK